MLLTGVLLYRTTKIIFFKKIVLTLTFELKRQLKPKLDEVGLLPDICMDII